MLPDSPRCSSLPAADSLPRMKNAILALVFTALISTGFAEGKVDFQTLLSAVIDVLNLNQEYFRAIADHEIAIAKLKEIIGDQS